MLAINPSKEIFKQATAPFSLSEQEEQGFYSLWRNFLQQKSAHPTFDSLDVQPLDWHSLPSLAEIHQRGRLQNESYWLKKTAVLKLNGGLGTTMGCAGPKTAIEVQKNDNFLDLLVQQKRTLEERLQADLPLLFLNSFSTQEETTKILKKYDLQGIHHLEQSRYLRLEKESLLPVDWEDFQKNAYYPPGHGEVFRLLEQKKVLEHLLAEGKEYLFLSNADNLAASVDLSIVKWMAEEKIDFVTEVTERTKWDAKGGFFVLVGSKIELLETAVWPSNIRQQDLAKKFPAFNTNNIWVHLPSLKQQLAQETWKMPVIANEKRVLDKDVIQLETAMGAAIGNFPKARLLRVNRDRFLPVKTCNDLFLLQSALFSCQGGFLTKRSDQPLPYIQLGEYFASVEQFKKRLPEIPAIEDLESLTVLGDVQFSRSVVLRGRVLIIADKAPLTIPEGAIFSNQVVTGNLKIAAL